MKRLFMETTKICPAKTVAKLQEILGEYGAEAIMIEYKEKEVFAVSFSINVKDSRIPFRLPCRWEAIYKVLGDRLKKGISNIADEKLKEQAKRVAWRQILRWVEAQLALVQTDMVKIQEVFMPYIQVNIGGQTLYEKLEDSKFKMIENK